MDEKMIDLQKQMDAKLDAAKAAEGAEAKEALLDEFDSLKKEYEAEKRLVEAEKAHVSETALEEKEHEDAEKKEKDAIAAFAKAARTGFKAKDASESSPDAGKDGLNEGIPADGGYTVPEDISTKIIHLRDAEFNLRQLVDVRKTRFKSGERTFRKRAQHQGFTKIGEGGKIPKIGKPEFARVEYNIDKYGGFMFVTNELLADTDANIVAEISDWFAQESRVTGNKLILATADESTQNKVNLGSIDDMKEVINVMLGQAFAPTSKIVTNDDGLQILDTLTDNDGNSLLKTHNNDPMDMYISVGFRKVPLKILPNADLATDAKAGVPMLIGDLKEGIKFFDRMLLSMKMSDVASAGGYNAMDEDLVIWRGIEREDCILFDDMAFRNCFWNKNSAPGATTGSDTNATTGSDTNAG